MYTLYLLSAFEHMKYNVYKPLSFQMLAHTTYYTGCQPIKQKCSSELMLKGTGNIYFHSPSCLLKFLKQKGITKYESAMRKKRTEKEKSRVFEEEKEVNSTEN